MDMPYRIGQSLLAILPLIAVEILLVFIDMPGNDIEIEPLGRLRLTVHEQRQRFRRGITQPFVDSESVAPGFGDLLALVVEKQLVVEALGWVRAERTTDITGQLDRVDQVLAGHLIVDTERDPAQRPIRLPLTFDV